MSAQSAVDPSMEDILASIRKIIADDSADESEGNNGVDAQANKAGGQMADPVIAGNQAENPVGNPASINSGPVLQPIARATDSGGNGPSGNGPRGNEPSGNGTGGNEPNGFRTEMAPGQNPVAEKPPTLNPSTLNLPPVLQERRENLQGSVPATSRKPNPSAEAGNKPLIRPSVSQTPLSLAREIASANSTTDARTRKQQEHVSDIAEQDLRQNRQVEAESSAAVPEFIETKPLPIAPQDPIKAPQKPIDSHQENIPQTPIETDVTLQPAEALLHPAIANAKAFVSSQGENKGAIKMPEYSEKPVFSQPSQSPLVEISNPAEPLVSPDSMERREIIERRNHPLRRGDGRDEAGFKNDLMSPQTDNAVHGAFERLKNTTFDGLDPKVEALLRPMLREWLDNNLPSMVERLVRNEIERVSRGE